MEALPPCWPSVPLVGVTTFPETFGQFQMDSSCNPKNQGLCDLLHEGASACYQTFIQSQNLNLNQNLNLIQNVTIGQQCCYGSDSRLLVGPPGGGRLQMFNDYFGNYCFGNIYFGNYYLVIIIWYLLFC